MQGGSSWQKWAKYKRWFVKQAKYPTCINKKVLFKFFFNKKYSKLKGHRDKTVVFCMYTLYPLCYHWSYALPCCAGYSDMKTPDSNRVVAAYTRKSSK